MRRRGANCKLVQLPELWLVALRGTKRITPALARAAQLPCGEARQKNQAGQQQDPAKILHGAFRAQTAASFTASSISTATKRDTPGSFMVTPMS
jgi:hypothetical protein